MYLSRFFILPQSIKTIAVQFLFIFDIISFIEISLSSIFTLYFIHSACSFLIFISAVSAQLGFKTEFYSKSLGFNPENFDLEYYQRETDGAETAEIKIKKLQAECIKYKVKMEEREISIKEIISKINKNCTAIVLIDWGKIKNLERYIGHFLPIVGFDEENIYLHQPDPKDPEPNFKINKNLFDIARKSKGTDEDIIFIYRKMHYLGFEPRSKPYSFYRNFF